MSSIPTDPNDPLAQEFIPAPPPPPRDQLSGHEYDGIQEYDNPTPGWWTAIFAVSVFFSFFYFVYYHAGVPDRSVRDDYDVSVAADLKKRFATMGTLSVTEPNMLQWMANPEYLKVGQSVFKGNCVSCHGADGQGLVGPNLTDEYYKNIKKLTDFSKVVANGANNGAMPAWANRLHPNEVALVSAYVATLRGKNLPGPPNTQLGEPIPAWPPLPAATQPAATPTATPSK